MKTIEFDMVNYVHDLCGFVRGESALGDIALDIANPDYDMKKDESKQTEIDAESKRLLDNPIELEDADIEQVLSLYKTHKCDLLEFAEVTHRYFKKLADEQAEELFE